MEFVPAAASIELDKTSETLNSSKSTVTLTATVKNSTDAVTWTSSDNAVATVAADADDSKVATVTLADGVTTGTATITATLGTGDDAPTATCTVTVSSHEHNWGEGTVSTPATCNEAGVRTFTCTGDGACPAGGTKTEPIAALGHNTAEDATAVADVTATCTADGLTGKKICGRNNNGTTCQEVIVAGAATPRTGHLFPAGSTAGDKCTKCDVTRPDRVEFICQSTTAGQGVADAVKGYVIAVADNMLGSGDAGKATIPGVNGGSETVYHVKFAGNASALDFVAPGDGILDIYFVVGQGDGFTVTENGTAVTGSPFTIPATASDSTITNAEKFSIDVTNGKTYEIKRSGSSQTRLAALVWETPAVATKDITFTVDEGVTPAIQVGGQAATLTDGKLTVAESATVTFTLTVDPAYKLGTVTGATESGGTYTVETTATTVVIPATKRPVISVDKDSVHVSADATSDQHTDTVTVTVTDGNVANVTVSSSADATATATISGGVITITGVAEGNATVTVALTDATSKTIAVEVAAAGAHVHSYGGWTVKTAGNCVDKAVEERTCANTDGNCTKVTDTRETAVDPTNHKGPQSAKAGTAVAATCAAAGHEADTYCEACDTKTADGAVIAKTNDHTFVADKPKCTVCNEAANPDYEGPTAEWDLDFTASEAMAKDATVESVDGVKLTVGAAFGWNAANADGTTTEETLSAEAGMPGVLKGSGGGPSDKAAVPADGKSYLKFDATKDGSLLVAYAVFGTNAKTVYVVDATGAAVAGAGETNFTGNGYSEFDVVSGGTYYVYAGGANIGFYGFSFTADEGGDEPAPDKKTVTFSVGADTQVTDIKVDGVAAELVGGKLTDIAKAAVVTFQAAVTDATKTLKVTGATFADGVYTVTADTVTVTAVAAGEEPGPGPDDPTAPTTGVFTFDIGEMVTAGKLTVETHAGGDPAPQLSELGTEGLFTIITKKSGGSTIEERSDKHTFADGYAGTHQFKTGGSASDMAKLESEGKAIKFTTGAQSTVKVWWVSGSGSGSSLALANKSGEADPVQFYADAEKSAQNVGVITIIENVPAGTNYLYSPDGTARFYKVVVAVGDSKLPDGNEPGPGPDDPGPDDPGKDDPADTAALNDAIKAADKLAGTYTVRADTTVAANVTNGSKYVLQSDKDALDAAIAAAKAVAAKTDATQAEVDKAVTDLNAAMDAFNAAVKTGTKTSSGSTGGGTSIRDDRGETPVTSSTTVTTADGLKVTIDKSSDGAVSITAVNADGEVVAKVSLPATIPSVGYKFVDVPDEHWAAKSINDMAGLGMVKGVDEVNHIFDMNSNVTRGAVATIIYRMANGKSGMENIFDDVAADVWYTDGIAWANKAGVVNGFEDGSFRPDGNITREQLAVMIARFAKIIGLDTTNTGTLLSFKDGTKVQAWAVDGVSWCVANGIINGRGDGTIDPAANATRAEAAAMLDRFVQLLK